MDGEGKAIRERPAGDRSASRGRLEWVGLGATLIALAGFTALQLRSSHQEIETTERNRLAHQGRIVERMLGTRLQATVNALDALRADVPDLLPRPDGLARLNDRMRLMVSSMVGVRTFILVDRAGIGVASNRHELVGLDFHESERYRAIRSRPDPSELYVSPPFTTPIGNWALSLGRAVLDAQGGFDGYILAIIDPEYFNLLLDSTRYAPDMSAALTHGGGLIIYRVPEVKGAVGMNLAQMPDALFNKHVQSGESLTAWTGALKTTGKDALMVFQTIRPSRSPSDGFLVASFTRDTDAMFASWRKEVRDRFTLLAVITLASSAGLFLHQRRRASVAREEAAREAERERYERSLRDNAAELQAILDAVPAAVWIARDPRGTKIDANRFGAELLRRPPGTNVSVTAPTDERPRNFRPMKDGREIQEDDLPIQAAARFGRECRDFEFDLVFDDGTVRHLLGNSSPMWGDDGRARGSVGAFVDITEHKKAEVALRASEARFRGLFESLMDGFVVVGMDGVIRECNEVYRKMLGYSAEELAQVAHKDLTPERWHPFEARVVEQVLRLGYSEVYEKEYRRKDGTIIPVELRTFLLRENGRPVAMWAIVRDVSEIRALQAQLALTSRLAAMGTLVAGVAHEVNNPLAAVLADRCVASKIVQDVRDRLRMSEPLDRPAEARRLDEVIETLEDAEEAGRRIAQIVKDLAKFADPSKEKARVRLIDAVKHAMRWLPETVGRAAAVSVEDGGAPDVVASAGQIEQVVANLVTNAAKASKPGELGAIVIRASPGSPGMSRLEVIDKGVGIDPAVRDRIFDPFFTTRQVGEGKGMGLGLSICHSIVTAHGGTLTVQSEVGKGTTFRMELPVAPAE